MSGMGGAKLGRGLGAVWLVAAWLVAAWSVGAGPMAAASSPPPPPPEGGGVLGALWRTMVNELDRASAARAPVAMPPAPVALVWKPRRLVAPELVAPVLDLAVGDLDGDQRADVVVLTDRELVVLRRKGGELRTIARAPLPDVPASVGSRDPVGSVEIVAGAGGAEIAARSSTVGRGGRYRIDQGALREVAALDGFPQCGGEAQLALGRNYFQAAPEEVPYLTRRCRADLVDDAGRPIAVRATVGLDELLTVVVETRCGAQEAACVVRRELTRDLVGAAIAVDDLDRDGDLDLIITGAGAPGDPDAVAVLVLDAGGIAKHPRFRKGFPGGVTAVGSGDIDGDGEREVIAAVRAVGTGKVELWLLN